jgi:uncharacterized membrane protein YfcA
MSYLIIALVALSASLLTFFSGFGLGTILTPFFVLFFPLEVAVALTGVVHFLNNVFKLSLTGKNINKEVLLRFGMPAFFAAFCGAMLLAQLGTQTPLLQWNNGRFEVTTLKLVMSFLMIVFALFELIPYLKNLSFDKKYLSVGGILSGFLGGFSGHQGALRSAFLLRYGLQKEAFIATGVAIACIIDITRLSVYYKHFLATKLIQHWDYIGVATIAAFIGAYFGNKLLAKATFTQVQQTVAIVLLVIALLLGGGVI